MSLTDTLLKLGPRERCNEEELQHRINWCKELVLKQVEGDAGNLLHEIRKRYRIAYDTAITYLQRARRELGETCELSEQDFQATFVERMFAVAFDPAATNRDKIHAMNVLAKCRILAKAVDKPVIPSLANPNVLEAALKLDQAISEAGNST